MCEAEGPLSGLRFEFKNGGLVLITAIGCFLIKPVGGLDRGFCAKCGGIKATDGIVCIVW